MKNILYRLFAEIFGSSPNKPVSLGEIKSDELTKLLSIKKEKGVIYLNPTKIYTVDKKYNLSSISNIANFLSKDNVSFQKFRLENNDCDNFAVQLAGRLNQTFPGFAVGFALSSNHAFNLFVDYKKQVYIIEPQTDEIISLEKALKDKKYSPLMMVLI